MFCGLQWKNLPCSGCRLCPKNGYTSLRGTTKIPVSINKYLPVPYRKFGIKKTAAVKSTTAVF